MTKKILILTGGGDCPGLNPVIRAITRAAHYSKDDWEVLGSIKAFCGILDEPQKIIKLTNKIVAGLEVKGGTILETTNKGDPFCYPTVKSDGSFIIEDRSDELITKIKKLGVEAVICIGGDGTQAISQKLYEKGLNIIGVPKTIDNDLSATDFTFGFQTAVETATEAVDKLVTTAQSHNRVMIAEVMGRDAGWIALYTAVAAGAEIALIPEIPYDIEKIIQTIKGRIVDGQGFVNIVMAEGAKPKKGKMVTRNCQEKGYHKPLLGGIGFTLMEEIKKRLDVSIRVTVLGHIQRGGTPIAFDRILATQFGIKSFELAERKQFGHMVSLLGANFTSIPIKKAIAKYKCIAPDNYLLNCARKLGICLGN
ncbi:ATP-dependent 6-phosphofructokinase [bacterium]|nr:ATP-dependent 6-phosphofructokinase [bacterium]MBT4551498.1 ATP-dependent 6-phosphofructokinase [bacterium]